MVDWIYGYVREILGLDLDLGGDGGMEGWWRGDLSWDRGARGGGVSLMVMDLDLESGWRLCGEGRREVDKRTPYF